MIEAKLEFPFSNTRLVLEALLALPEALRPTHKSLGEDEVGKRIGDETAFLQHFELPSIGIFLKNSNALYDLRTLINGNLTCCAYFKTIPYAAVRQFLIDLARARPIFGFACLDQELAYRNRITAKFGMNTIESWVGRDTRKYIPGLYWWTLLPAAFLKQHDIPLSIIVDAALEHVEIEGQQHLLRFYEKPEDWQSTPVKAELYRSLPGLFDIEKVRPKLQRATTFLEINAALDAWR